MNPPPRKRLTIDDAHTPEQFAGWLQVSPAWVRARLFTLPGRIVESRKVVRFIPRRYIEARVMPKSPQPHCPFAGGR